MLLRKSYKFLSSYYHHTANAKLLHTFSFLPTKIKFPNFRNWSLVSLNNIHMCTVKNITASASAILRTDFKLNGQYNTFKTQSCATISNQHSSVTPECEKSMEDSLNYADDEWDIIISGGGMVGTAMACSLGHSDYLANKKILLLEGCPPIARAPLLSTYSNKVVSLTPGTKDLLNSFGAWKSIIGMRVKAVKKLQIFEACSDALIVFQLPGMTEDISYIVEQDVLLHALSHTLDGMKARIKVMNGIKVVKYEVPNNQYNMMDNINSNLITITLQNGKKLKTKLLIGADGINSLVRKSISVKYVSWSYNQKAIVATLKLSELAENTVAWQNFLPSGPIALLPLTDDTSSLVWSTSTETAEDLMKMSDEDFVDSLNYALWDQTKKNALADSAMSALNTFISYLWPERSTIRQLPPSILSIQEGSRACFPLGLGHACHYASPRVVLIGDAAHRVHPLAGLGVNLGFGDVSCLTKALEDSLYAGNDIGCFDPLLKYETKRQRELVPVMAVIDGLQRLYSTTFTPTVILRSIGLQLINAVDPLKEKIIECASK